jgi:signal transduction histidine kinase
MRRDFVANVSHELKTPLTVVSGFAETIGDEALPHAQQKLFADTIVANTKRMQRLVDDLLDLSRIESGGWRPNPSTVDVSTVAADVLLAVAEAATKKGLSLSQDVAHDASSAFADPIAFRQVLSNLVDNSVRHTATGSVTIFTHREGQGIWVGVRDTGSGIPEEHLSRVFERFYRVDAARSRNEGGTGLGLAIVKHLVENHGGRVWAESTVGVGTSISAFFPDRRS